MNAVTSTTKATDLKLVQLMSHGERLLGLDNEGNVWQYHFGAADPGWHRLFADTICMKCAKPNAE